MYATRVHEEPIRIALRGRTLDADLTLPADPYGLILFAHGSGSSRFSTRNRSVAAALWAGGFATLMLDLLTPSEERADAVTREHRFNIQLLAERVVAAIDWAQRDPRTHTLPIGLFGASTGAAAALIAAAQRPAAVAAVVSRGGRPDLAITALAHVKAPTLLIVGGLDDFVITLNEGAMARLHCVAKLEIVPMATHLFEEPGALDRVTALARSWFLDHVPVHTSSGSVASAG